MDSSLTLLESDQEKLLEKLGIFKIQGRDKVGRKVLLITGKLFPARVVSIEVLKKYLEEKIYPKLEEKPFSVVYMQTDVQTSKELYSKLKYVTRLEFLWDHVRRSEIEMPEFVYDHDEELEYRPMMDYGLESDHPGVYGGPSMDNNPLSVYSLRDIA
ncbi:GANGLIOSIDE INDUCED DIFFERENTIATION ASSOCIATED PROTEIN 2-RELATED [Salix koriyanagi]|uniref:GANGLIOSIDE INDUCED DIFFERENTIATION ASSOCIATED PROTEIN 2-RELATED n=1 Tax=Salix koriyanagi TaxID=2511006 RepID=A0A9Q0P3M7_9ROSI|nr:GANGLIOSIDE INDUCED DIFFERENTIATION ASSOCIATED PROTEIN 2-RELATED [Salix koriyanagi]